MLTDVFEFHAFCLTATGTRLDQYARALEQAVTPGAIVLDVGSGSGILAFMASRLGARHVYAVEEHPQAIGLGARLAKSLGLSDRVTFITGSIFDLAPTERADVVVADIHGPFGLQEGGFSALADAHARWLKPGGALIPQAIELLVAPVEAPDLYARRVDVWRRTVHGVALDPIRALAVNCAYGSRFRAADLLSPTASLAQTPLGTGAAARLRGRSEFTAVRRGTLHGICGAMRSTLAAGITLCNAPGDDETTEFACAFLPVDEPVAVEAGDQIVIEVTAHDGAEFRWVVDVATRRAGSMRFQHATLLSRPEGTDWFRRLSDSYKPRLTQKSELELALASQFDGTRTAADLDTWLADRWPDGMAAQARSRLLKAAIERFG